MDSTSVGEDNANLFRITMDTATGIIQVVVQGFWSSDSTDSYFKALAPLLIESRKVSGYARLLVDRRGASIQSADVAARLQISALGLAKTGDRLAVIAASTLGKLQMERLVPSQGAKVFRDAASAEAWLLQ